MSDMWEGQKSWDDFAQARQADQWHAESFELADRVSRGLAADAYLHDPVRWLDAFIDWKGGGLADYQRRILGKLCEQKRLAVRGPHGLGKTGMAALTVVWFALTRDRAGIDWKVVSTATAWRHLTIYLWPEIHKWLKRVKWEEFGMTPPNSRTQMLDLRLKLMHGAASAVASDDPVNIEGAHADSLLYLFDESKAIPPETWDAAEGALSGGMPEGFPEALVLAISTPGAPSGRFYDIHARKRGFEDWHPVHVTVDEVVRAGRINPEWVEQRKLQFGEDSAVFKNRVLGEFCAADEDSVIPLAWVEAAIERWHEWDEGGRPLVPAKPVLSIDVARSGSDKTVFSWRQENVITHFSEHTKRDTMAVTALAQQDAGRASGMFSSTGFPRIVVDAIGVGAGVYDRLKELKYDVTAHVGSAKTHIRDESGQFEFTNCLTGDAVVAPIGRLKKVYRSRHNGPLFRIKMASGDEFTATPNHNILTPGGWKTVQALNVGDQVVDAGRGWRDAQGQPQISGVPAKISDIYHAARQRFGSEWVGGGAVNFHGDTPDGDVEVVTINGELRGGVSKDLSQPVKRDDLIRALHGESALPGPRGFTFARGMDFCRSDMNYGLPAFGPSSMSFSEVVGSQSRGASFDGFVERSELDGLIFEDATHTAVGVTAGSGDFLDGLSNSVSGGDLGGRLRSEHQCDGFLSSAQSNAMLTQDASNDVHVDAMPFGQGVQGFSTGVRPDDVADVDVVACGKARSFSPGATFNPAAVEDFVDGGSTGVQGLGQRHDGFTTGVALDEIASVDVCSPSSHDDPFVYTLETETGSYMSQNTIHRNCRSAAYWTLRELLDPANEVGICLPDDDEMIGELTAPRWEITTGAPPKIKVEKKEDVHKRLGRSPDRADSISMSFWLERIKRAGTPVSNGAHTFANADITRGPPLPRASEDPQRSPFANLPNVYELGRL